ncbi:MAG: hypothetical protein HXX08_22715 [Chloroflexi bacterium]|uniref:Uncharacterized protein n=1 Tax=Candidatus Chlorohelix allophototropha TaxID=3003348 RepID=A0A8T7M9K3_9CHLR|nr:hypothetical protein [Chloroflexota bacterium]WJW68614.1 hypothetical protein OZ401_004228 [Chloroflexota bacterium L227-S17]
MATVESIIPSALWAADFTMTVLDPNGRNPSTIIRNTDAWQLKVDINLSGLIVPLVGGTFHIQPYIEALGADQEGKLVAEKTQALTGASNYSLTFNVPNAASYPIVPGGVKLDPGPYRLTLVLTYTNLVNNPDEIAGFVEGPVIQIYLP